MSSSSAAPWYTNHLASIGSGIAAAAAVAVGLWRFMRVSNAIAKRKKMFEQMTDQQKAIFRSQPGMMLSGTGLWLPIAIASAATFVVIDALVLCLRSGAVFSSLLSVAGHCFLLYCIGGLFVTYFL